MHITSKGNHISISKEIITAHYIIFNVSEYEIWEKGDVVWWFAVNKTKINVTNWIASFKIFTFFAVLGIQDTEELLTSLTIWSILLSFLNPFF